MITTKLIDKKTLEPIGDLKTIGTPRVGMEILTLYGRVRIHSVVRTDEMSSVRDRRYEAEVSFE